MTTVGSYTIVVESRNGKATGERVKRVSHTGHPRVGEEVMLGERRYRVARVCHVEVNSDDGMPSGACYRFTVAMVHVHSARS